MKGVPGRFAGALPCALLTLPASLLALFPSLENPFFLYPVSGPVVYTVVPVNGSLFVVVVSIVLSLLVRY